MPKRYEKEFRRTIRQRLVGAAGHRAVAPGDSGTCFLAGNRISSQLATPPAWEEMSSR